MTPAEPRPPTDVEVAVIGAGQAGLSAAWFLADRGVAPGAGFVVLDANDGPGGAWQHRWSSLRLDDVHGIHPLPGSRALPMHAHGDAPAREVVADHFARYEARFELPIERPVRVDAVRRLDDGRFLVTAGDRAWRARGVLNATGTWTRPYWPSYPGMAGFDGEQLHTADYRDASRFAGHHVVVVGGGHSAIQHLAELAEVTTTTWVTRRPPRWRDAPFDEAAGRAAVAAVADTVAAGRRPDSVVSVTGLAETPLLQRARDLGALERLPMFDRVVPDGVAWHDGRHLRADVILWATGFRAALDHLAPLGLRNADGGITMRGTHVVGEPRVHLLGYGPSASTIGANRAARTAVRDLRRHLGLGTPVATGANGR